MLLKLRIFVMIIARVNGIWKIKMVGENGFDSVYPIPCRGDYLGK